MRTPSPPPPLLPAFSRTRSSGSLSSSGGSGKLVRVPQLLDLYQQLRRSKLAAAGIRTASRGGEGAPHVGCTAGVGGASKQGAAGDADAAQLFSQIMSKGSYVSKVQADVAEYGPALDRLAAAVARFQPADMAAVVSFVAQAQAQVGRHIMNTLFVSLLIEQKQRSTRAPPSVVFPLLAFRHSSLVSALPSSLPAPCLPDCLSPAGAGPPV